MISISNFRGTIKKGQNWEGRVHGGQKGRVYSGGGKNDVNEDQRDHYKQRCAEVVEKVAGKESSGKEPLRTIVMIHLKKELKTFKFVQWITKHSKRLSETEKFQKDDKVLKKDFKRLEKTKKRLQRTLRELEKIETGR